MNPSKSKREEPESAKMTEQIPDGSSESFRKSCRNNRTRTRTGDRGGKDWSRRLQASSTAAGPAETTDRAGAMLALALFHGDTEEPDRRILDAQMMNGRAMRSLVVRGVLGTSVVLGQVGGVPPATRSTPVHGPAVVHLGLRFVGFGCKITPGFGSTRWTTGTLTLLTWRTLIALSALAWRTGRTWSSGVLPVAVLPRDCLLRSEGGRFSPFHSRRYQGKGLSTSESLGKRRQGRRSRRGFRADHVGSVG